MPNDYLIIYRSASPFFFLFGTLLEPLEIRAVAGPSFFEAIARSFEGWLFIEGVTDPMCLSLRTAFHYLLETDGVVETAPRLYLSIFLVWICNSTITGRFPCFHLSFDQRSLFRHFYSAALVEAAQILLTFLEVLAFGHSGICLAFWSPIFWAHCDFPLVGGDWRETISFFLC